MAITKTNKPTGGNNSTSKFSLPNRKVTLVPIIRKSKFMGSESHDGAFMYTGTTQSWTIFRDKYGNYIDPLTDTERIFLESKLNEKLNTEHKQNYWKEFEVKIKKDVYDLRELKRVFDLSKPKDFLAYKLLLTVPDVANSLKEKDLDPLYKWVLIEKDEPIQGKLTKAKLKIKAYSWLSENTDKTSNMKDILYVLNINISRDITRDELESKIVDLIEGDRITQLVELIEDEDLSTKILFAKSLKSRELKITRGKYYTTEGVIVGSNQEQVMDWLVKPENSTNVIVIKRNIDKLKL